MKVLLAMTMVLASLTSIASTSAKVSWCDDQDDHSIALTTSLMPSFENGSFGNLEYITLASSSVYGDLKNVKCSNLPGDWQYFELNLDKKNLKTCHVNAEQDALITVYTEKIEVRYDNSNYIVTGTCKFDEELIIE